VDFAELIKDEEDRAELLGRLPKGRVGPGFLPAPEYFRTKHRSLGAKMKEKTR